MYSTERASGTRFFTPPFIIDRPACIEASLPSRRLAGWRRKIRVLECIIVATGDIESVNSTNILTIITVVVKRETYFKTLLETCYCITCIIVNNNLRRKTRLCN